MPQDSVVVTMYKPGSVRAHSTDGGGGREYELVEGGQVRLDEGEEWSCMRKVPAPIAAAARRLGISSRQSLWRNVMPIITLLLAGSLFIITVVFSLRYVKLSGIYRPAYRNIPPISQAQIDAATSRHLTNDQCVDLYPGLFE